MLFDTVRYGAPRSAEGCVRTSKVLFEIRDLALVVCMYVSELLNGVETWSTQRIGMGWCMTWLRRGRHTQLIFAPR